MIVGSDVVVPNDSSTKIDESDDSDDSRDISADEMELDERGGFTILWMFDFYNADR